MLPNAKMFSAASKLFCVSNCNLTKHDSLLHTGIICSSQTLLVIHFLLDGREDMENKS